MSGPRMKRRTFIAGLASAAAWPVVARAQTKRLGGLELSSSYFCRKLDREIARLRSAQH
jgi:hypothetical protein